MAKGPSHVPEFGSWYKNDTVPFTAVFDQARAGKGGKMINPNDPLENPFAGKMINPNDPLENPLAHQSSGEHQRVFVQDAPAGSYPRSPLRRPMGVVPQNNLQPEKSVQSGHGASLSTSADLPRRSFPTQMNQVHGSERSPQHALNQSNRSQHVQNHSNFDHSPLHAQASQARHVQPGSASPAFERRVPSESGSATPGRSRNQASTKSLQQLDSTSLPKFGAWDANDPSSADNFTVLFERARVERKSEAIGITPGTPGRYEEGIYKPSRPSNRRWCCCFQPTHADT